MSDFGIFCLDRGWFEHPVFAAEPFTEREAWAWMIAAAARGAKLRRVGEVQVPLARGQLAHSIRFMGQRFQWHPAKVQRFLRRLVAECMIELVTESGVTCVLIKNYDKYQPAPPLSGVSSVTSPDRVTDTVVSQQHSAASPCGSNDLPSARAGPESANESAAIQIKENKTITTDSNGDGSSARAREALISDESLRLANDVMKILAIDTEFVPPGWYGAAMWLQAGLASGWSADLVRIAAAKVRARRHYEPPFTFRYLGKPIQREHELAAIPPLPLPPVAIHQPEPPHAQRSPNDWRDRRDAQHAAFQQFRAGRQAAERERDENDGGVVRLVPHARRG